MTQELELFPPDEPPAQVDRSLLDPHIVPSFDTFWEEYPRKERKADARRYWSAMSAPERASAWIALQSWLLYWQARNQPQFIPQGGTWLHQKRWEDTVPPLPMQERHQAPGMAAVRRVLGR